MSVGNKGTLLLVRSGCSYRILYSTAEGDGLADPGKALPYDGLKGVDNGKLFLGWLRLSMKTLDHRVFV